MAQLIKIQDYVSRYEQDIYRYPARFIRLKKQQWEGIKLRFETIDLLELEQEQKDFFGDKAERESVVSKVKRFIPFRKRYQEYEEVPISNVQEDEVEEEDGLHFTSTIPHHINQLEDLKQHFLDQLLRFQLKWASSTLTEKSFLDTSYFFNTRLKFFLQRFPDTFFLMFFPIFRFKNAPVEAEIVLITPTETICLTFLEEEENAVYVGSNQHFWLKRYKEGEKKVLNPLLSINRTETIVKQLYQLYEIDLPIRKIVLCRNGYIDYPNHPVDVQFIEKRNFDEWFQTMRKLRSPIKHVQLKAAQALLQYCQTSSVRRLEWEQD